MGALNSEVGYTSAKTRRGNHEVYRDMWWHWNKKNYSVSKVKDFIVNSNTECLF
jgi:hypothetical protein